MVAKTKIRIWHCGFIAPFVVGITAHLLGGDTAGTIAVLIMFAIWCYLFFTLMKCRVCGKNLLQGVIRIGFFRFYFVRFSPSRECPYCKKGVHSGCE